MNEAPMKPHGTTTQTRPGELSEPHFDDIAVLIAQPVEPIATGERDWLAWLEKPRMMIAILVVAGLLGTTALALTLQLPRERQADSAATGVPADKSPAQRSADKSAAQPESPLGALTEQLKSTAPRPRNRKARSDETKPVARRVGVIVYGSSSEP